jgi:hypothetical protein
MGATSSHALYATFARRIRALVYDWIVLLGLLLAVVFLAALLPWGETARITFFALVISLSILYEPVLVAFRGRTVGQQLCNLLVVAPTPSGRLPLWKAFVRWLLKVLTGIASFATMGATQRNQALHDLPFNTTVEIADPSVASPSQYIRERSATAAGRLPSRWRRLLVITGYLVLLYVLAVVVTGLVVPEGCLGNLSCSRSERLPGEVVGTAWLAASIAVSIFGWKGRLFGARSRQQTPSSVGDAIPPVEPQSGESP